jgi:hypothetical protein
MNIQERIYIRSTYYTLNILAICMQTMKQIFKKQFCKVKSGWSTDTRKVHVENCSVFHHNVLTVPPMALIQNEPVKTVTEQLSIHMVSQKPCTPGEHENSC